VTSFTALFRKEVLRFWKVFIQTVAAPVLTALLYLVVFAHALEGRMRVYDAIPYTEFLVPGLVMMSVLPTAPRASSSRKSPATSCSSCCRRSRTSSSSAPMCSPP
jgi:hypothetical protein